MTYWTILWVTLLGGPYDGEQTFMVYPSIETCEASLSAVGDTLPYDYQIECEVTDVLSSSLRPKRSPRYED